MGGLDVGVVLVAVLVLRQLGGQIGLGGGLGGGDGLAAVGIHRRPGDGDGHVAIGHMEVDQRVADLVVDMDVRLALIIGGVDQRSGLVLPCTIVGAAQGNVGAVDGDATDGVLLTVDGIGHAAGHGGHVVVRHEAHASRRVGNFPALSVDDSGALAVARLDGRVAA